MLDTPFPTRALTDTLQQMAGVEVVGSATGEVWALDWIASRPDACDIAIVDIFLKGRTGLAVLERMRPQNAPTVRVVLTHYATTKARAGAEELGAAAVFG